MEATDPRIAEFERLLDTLLDCYDERRDFARGSDAGAAYAALLAWVRAHLPGEPVGYALMWGEQDEEGAFPIIGRATTLQQARDAWKTRHALVRLVALHPVPDGGG